MKLAWTISMLTVVGTPGDRSTGSLCPWKRSRPLLSLASAIKVRPGPEGTSKFIVTVVLGVTGIVVGDNTDTPPAVTLRVMEETPPSVRG